jgi:Protein of unknown function (DUF3300)
MRRNMKSIGVETGNVYLSSEGGRKMKNKNSFTREALGIFCMLLLLVFSVGAPLAAQDQQDQAARDQGPGQGQDQGQLQGDDAQQQAPAPPAQALSPDQLANLVAPIALYPDNLLSQILVASTYPLEVVEAGQWLRQNGNLQGQQRMDAARQQNWDPSVQALVVFPDVLNRLNSDIRWTTDLGNAFLAQQADVMNAVQRLRAEARANGKLNSSPQETVTTQNQGDQSAIAIQPADPQVVYVPTYNPEYVWGPPVYGYYPPLYYPAVGFGFGFGFGPGIYIGSFFGGLGWGGWGWGPNWFGGGIFVNGFFFNHYGFGGGFYGGRAAWAFNPAHRMGVAYPNSRLAARYGGSFAGRSSLAGRSSSFAGRSSSFANHGGFANHGSFADRGSSAARSYQGNGFRSSGSQPSYRSSPAYGGGSAYRSAPSYGNSYSGARSTPSYRSSSPSSGSTYRSAPAHSSSSGSSYHSSGGSSSGGSFHSSGGGGGSHGGGGGGGRR